MRPSATSVCSLKILVYEDVLEVDLQQELLLISLCPFHIRHELWTAWKCEKTCAQACVFVFPFLLILLPWGPIRTYLWCLEPIQRYIVNGVILLVQIVANGAYCDALIARTNNRLFDVLRLWGVLSACLVTSFFGTLLARRHQVLRSTFFSLYSSFIFCFF
jgi:hypothetical protein